MANLYTIKSQMKSIVSVEKMTQAMKIISSAKFSSCQSKIKSFDSHCQEMNNLMNISKWHWSDQKYSDLDWLFKLKHDSSSINLQSVANYISPLVIVLFSDMGLCGDINSSISSFAKGYISTNSKVIVIGKKGLNRIKGDLFLSYDELQSQIQYLVSGHDSCFVIFNDFVSMLHHKSVCHCIFPFAGDENFVQPEDFSIFEPDYAHVIEKIFNLYLDSKLQEVIYSQNMSEYSTRVISMNSANDNANAIINRLKLLYNRGRQTKITQEIIEIVSGMEIIRNN